LNTRHIAPTFITEERVRDVLRMDHLIPAIEQILIDFSAGIVIQPVRTVLHLAPQEGWFGLMPAVCGDIMGAKLVTVYPANAQLGLPTHLATIQLFNASTGAALTVMDGRLITEMRTAAVSAIATSLLASDRVRVLAILGSGVQAKAHLDALSMVRQFEEIRVWSRTQEHAARFAAENNVVAMQTAEAAVRDADVVVTVTGAAEPVLFGKWLKPGAYVNAVGAVGPNRRELDNEAMQATVVVESREASMRESGDILMSGSSIYAEIGELLAGSVRKMEGQRIVFKSLGIGCEDIAAAWLVCRALGLDKGGQTLQISKACSRP